MSDDYEGKSNEELHGILSDREIAGRSSMNRDEMIAALRESDNAPATSDAPKAGADVGQSEVTDAVNEANAKGYYGTVPDETPNEHYTLSGVIEGKPTPENTTRGARAGQPHADRFGDLGDEK